MFCKREYQIGIVVTQQNDKYTQLKGGYLDMYDGIRSKVICTTKFNENSNLSTTHKDRHDLDREDESGRKIYIRTRT